MGYADDGCDKVSMFYFYMENYTKVTRNSYWSNKENSLLIKTDLYKNIFSTSQAKTPGRSNKLPLHISDMQVKGSVKSSIIKPYFQGFIILRENYIEDEI